MFYMRPKFDDWYVLQSGKDARLYDTAFPRDTNHDRPMASRR